MKKINLFILTLFYFWQNISYLDVKTKETPCMFQFEIIISERRGLEEIITFNRNKTDQHIENCQQLY